MVNNINTGGNMAGKSIRAIYFPYCLQKQANGNWCILNRNYKSVASNPELLNIPAEIQSKKLTSELLKKLSFNGEYDLDNVYLYNDSCIPTHSNENMKSYLKKLEILLLLDADE